MATIEDMLRTLYLSEAPQERAEAVRALIAAAAEPGCYYRLGGKCLLRDTLSSEMARAFALRPLDEEAEHLILWGLAGAWDPQEGPIPHRALGIAYAVASRDNTEEHRRVNAWRVLNRAGKSWVGAVDGPADSLRYIARYPEVSGWISAAWLRELCPQMTGEFIANGWREFLSLRGRIPPAHRLRVGIACQWAVSDLTPLYQLADDIGDQATLLLELIDPDHPGRRSDHA